MRASLAERLQIPAKPPLSMSACLRQLLLQAVRQLTATTEPAAEEPDRLLLQQFLAAALVDDPTKDWYLRQLAIVNRGKRLSVLPTPTSELIDCILANGLEQLQTEVFLRVAVDPVVVITCAEQMKSEFPVPWRSLIDSALEDLLTQTELPPLPGAVATQSSEPQSLTSQSPIAAQPTGSTAARRPPLMLMSLSLGADDIDDDDKDPSSQAKDETDGETGVDEGKGRLR